jgi:hypothetical protein
LSDPTAPDDFRSAEEFAALMLRLSGRMHAKNRIWMGESGYAYRVAMLLQAIGQDFAASLPDDATVQVFGAAWQPGSLTGDADQVDALLARLRQRLLPQPD